MSIGLIALLDEIAALAKVAAASLDDVVAQAAKAGIKTAGVVVDDAAVTPRYVLGFAAQRELPIVYKDVHLEGAFRIDLLVEELVLIEVKAVEKLLPVHEAQLLTYLKLTGPRLGLLINFNSTVVSSSLRRVVRNL